MKPSYLKQALLACMKARTSVFMWGPPGCGKSSIVYEITNDLSKTLHEMRALLYEPSDIRGFPSIVNGQTITNPPSTLPRQANCLIFLDELNAAPALTQNSLLQLVIPPHKIGDYTLPGDCGIIAAGNRESDRAHTTRMGSALSNRFVHLNFDVDADDWMTWAIQKNLHPLVTAFIRFRPGLLMNFDPSKNEKAFASPRSMEMLSKVLTCGDFLTLPKEVQIGIVYGTIGEGAGAEFMGFLEIWESLPNPDLVFTTPDSVEVPQKPAVLYALCGAISRKVTTKTVDNFFKYLNRIPAEFAVMTVKDAIRKDAKIQNSKAFIGWASKNSNVLI